MKALPSSIEKRDILFGAKKVAGGTFLTLAQKYEAEGSLSDALDFFAKAEATEDLKRLAKIFIKEGDSFLLLKVAHLSHESVSEDDIADCAQKAEELGKTRYAILAHDKLGNEEKVEALKESISEDGDIIAEREAHTFLAASLEEIQDLEDEED